MKAIIIRTSKRSWNVYVDKHLVASTFRPLDAVAIARARNATSITVKVG